MSRAEIISEIPGLSGQDRREIMRCIVAVEVDAEALAECDQTVLERFQMLDDMDAEGEMNSMSL